MKPRIENSSDNSNKGIPLIKCLVDCVKGEEHTVFRVNAGYNAKRRLANLGILPGVKVIKKNAAPFRGPIEIIVRDSSLVIGRGLATKIMVKLVDS